MTDAGLALLLLTVWRLKTKDVARLEPVKLCGGDMLVKGVCWLSTRLVCLCWFCLVLTSVLSVKAVAVVGSVGITIQLN